ncbi:MAG: ABC transporter substrate-binding protein [Peptostreptococcaceae bacterium]|nr:ABC transporter substrate-binding protein [Peptostreptococcaceae bacterium]
MKRTLKKLAALALTVTTAMTFVACSGGEQKTKENSQASSDTILLGGIGPLTGDAAMYGISTYNGVQLAIDEINEAGGVLGKKIVLNKMDDKNDTVEAANAFNKLVEEKIVALIGAVTSKPSDAVAQIAAGNKIPMLAPTGTAQSITTHGENIFRAPFIDPYQGEVMAQFAKDELKVKKVAVIRNTASDYSDGLATAFVEKAKELGIEVVADESYKDADADFKAQLTKIQSANPEVLFIPDYYQKVSLIAPQAREVGITARLIGGDGWDGVIKSMGADKLSSIEGSYFCNTFALDDKDEKVQSFIKKYNETYKENPQSFSALGYDSVYLMVEAIKKANSTDSAAIVDALKNIEYTGVTGSFRFDENRNPIKSVFMTTIENGQYKLFKKFEAK